MKHEPAVDLACQFSVYLSMSVSKFQHIWGKEIPKLLQKSYQLSPFLRCKVGTNVSSLVSGFMTPLGIHLLHGLHLGILHYMYLTALSWYHFANHHITSKTRCYDLKYLPWPAVMIWSICHDQLFVFNSQFKWYESFGSFGVFFWLYQHQCVFIDWWLKAGLNTLQNVLIVGLVLLV